MAPPRPWTVNNPEPLAAVAPDIWAVDDDVPQLQGARRRMTIIRQKDGGLIFFNAIPLPEAQLATLRSYGTPAHLILPNAFHALDAHAFAQKLGVRVWAPAVSIERFAEQQLTCSPIEELPLEKDFERYSVTGFKTHEIVLRVRDSLITADVVTNAPNGPGMRGFMFRMVGFTGPRPRLPFPVRKRVMRNPQQVRSLLELLANHAQLRRIIPSHGTIFEGDVAGELRAIAASL